MYSKAIIMGYLGKDPESRTTKDGKSMTSFSVAVSEGYGDKKKTTWYRVTVFGRQAEACNQYLHKGNVVLVDGSLSLNEYTDKNGQNHASLDLLAGNVTFMPKQSNGQFHEGGPGGRRLHRGPGNGARLSGWMRWG